MRAVPGLGTVLLALAATLGWSGIGAPAAFAATACPAGLAPPTAQPITDQPWPQQRYDLDRLAGIADGSGVTVAVIDSGVDPDQPALRGRVIAGADLLADDAGEQDCVGHGTAVASIIAATPTEGSGLRGVAPGVRILPIRVTERTAEDNHAARDGSAAGLAGAIHTAVDRGARVLNISMVLSTDDAGVASAVRYALAHEVVVVAAAGNGHRSDGGADPASYPAAYPGVIGVGAIGPDGQRLAESQVGKYVSLTAPGDSVIAATLPRGLATFAGTSFAAPFVAGAAALVIQRYPQLGTAAVAQRLYSTADPAPEGGQSTSYGYGIVNPYRAATGADPGPVPSPVAASAAPARTPVAARHRRSLAPAIPLAAGAIVLVAMVILLAEVVPRGAKRGWRPGD